MRVLEYGAPNLPSGFEPVREPFAMTAEARARGYKPRRFSFNARGGRCEACGGDAGGKIVAQGTREQIAHARHSYTGHYLAPLLGVPQAKAS